MPPSSGDTDKKTQTIRPERPERLPYPLNDNQTWENWATQALQTPAQRRWKCALQMIVRGLGGSVAGFNVDSLFAPLSLAHAGGGTKAMRPLLTCTAAILYDIYSHPDPEAARRQVSHPPPPPVDCTTAGFWMSCTNYMLPSLLEHMLLVDYGIGEHPLRLPWYGRARSSRRKWRPALYRLSEMLSTHALACEQPIVPVPTTWESRNECIHFAKLRRCGDLADVALMLHYFHTHRREITRAAWDAGLTGYTGVIAEMVAEIPAMGPDRLLRKLSVDVTEMIPRHVRDYGRRARMTDVAYSIAREHGILHLLKPDEVAAPGVTRTVSWTTLPPYNPPKYPDPPPYNAHWFDEVFSESMEDVSLD